MYKRVVPLIALTSIVGLAACDQVAQKAGNASASLSLPQVKPSAENSVASVNGKAITRKELEIFKAEVGPRSGGDDVEESKLIDQLIKRELLRQVAVKGRFTDNPDYAARVENAERVVLSQVAAEKYIDELGLTDEEVKKEYETRVASEQRDEYRARHILVEKEAEAKDIIKRLAKGEKFDGLAKKLSRDPGSKSEGGELGWFSAQQMVAPFSEAVAKLKDGETTQEPVQTQFGWHVIQREESRKQQPPSFELVKDQLRNYVQTQKLHAHIEQLLSQAKVERFVTEPAAAEAPAAAADDHGKPEEPVAAPAAAAEPAPAASEPAK